MPGNDPASAGAVAFNIQRHHRIVHAQPQQQPAVALKRQLSCPLQTVALLTDAIMNDMTLRQSEVIYYKLLGLKETDIARNLGISQSGVNKASSATKWYCIEEALKYFEQINFNEYE